VDAARPLVMDSVRRHFRPEFLNRIDEIILFSRLGRAEMDGIVRIQLQRVEKLLADRRMTLSLDAAALHWLGERGYDPVYGARPLKRVIQKELVDPIARRLLAGDLEDGAVIDVTAGQDALVIGRAKDYLDQGESPDEAAGHATATIGRAVLTAGATVVIALVALLVFDVPAVTAMAYAVVLVVATATGMQAFSVAALVTLHDMPVAAASAATDE